jgi:EAL domain-containing protein (putative c-di-GMP-specific phosphodiesterase class I)
VDGFGAGRSNMDRVLGLRPDLVKVDRALFAEAAPGSARPGDVLGSVLGQIHDLRARVVVTGIEEAAQARAAVEAGADFVQGRFFAEPRAGRCDEACALERLRVALAVPGARDPHRPAR